MFFRKDPTEEGKRPRGASRKVERVRADRPNSTQFLTGDALRDQRSVEALLDEISRVSERVARVRGPADLRELLNYIVDASGLRCTLQAVAPSATSARAIVEAIVEATRAHARDHREDDKTGDCRRQRCHRGSGDARWTARTRSYRNSGA